MRRPEREDLDTRALGGPLHNLPALCDAERVRLRLELRVCQLNGQQDLRGHFSAELPGLADS